MPTTLLKQQSVDNTVTKKAHIKLRAAGSTTTEQVDSVQGDRILFAASCANYAEGMIPVPDDYVAGTSVTLVWLVLAASGNETISFVAGATSARDGVAISTGDIRSVTTTSSSFALVTTAIKRCTQSLGSTNIVAGGSIGVALRAASNGQSHSLYDCWIEYTAYL